MPDVLCCVILLFLLGQGSHGRKSEPETGGQDRYDFAIILSALEQQCIGHFAHQSGHFYLTYMGQGISLMDCCRNYQGSVLRIMLGCTTDGWKNQNCSVEQRTGAACRGLCPIQWVTGVGTQRQLSVTVSSPQGFPIALTDDAVGHLNFQAQETGFYLMCFSNFYNRFGRMKVFIDFGVYYEGYEEAVKAKAEENKLLNDSLSTIEDSINKLQGYIFHMWRHYNFARMRRGADHYLLLSNYNYVNWWSATQSVVIIMAGYLQLLILKRLFHTDYKKPRC